MARPVAIFGGLGDGLVVAEAIRAYRAAGGDLDVAGFLNDAVPKGGAIEGIPTLGRFEDWHSLPDDVLFMPAIHKPGEMKARIARIRSFGIPDGRWARVIHPSAVIASSAVVGPGAFIASHVTIQPKASIGLGASIRGGANIGHDALLGDFAYVGPNATLCGRSIVEEGAHVGPNSVILDRCVVGSYAIVGICSGVTKNVAGGEVVIGNPARRISLLAERNRRDG
jgi:acetyltransferase EpsM